MVGAERKKRKEVKEIEKDKDITHNVRRGFKGITFIVYSSMCRRERDILCL